MIAVFKKEFRSYMHGVIGWLFIAFLLLFEGLFCTVENLLLGSANFEYSLNELQIVLIVAIPLLAMRSVAEEKHNRTDQLLYSLPMRLSEVVLGKYLAMEAIFGISCAVIAVYPLLLTMYGTVAMTTAYCSLLAFFLLGSALLALCMFLSSLTESQIIAAVLSVAGVLLLYLLELIASVLPTSAVTSLIGFILLAVLLAVIIGLLTKNWVVAGGTAAVIAAVILIVYLIDASLFDGALRSFFMGVSLFSRYSLFCNGIVDLTTVVYDLSFGAFFLFLTYQALEKKRWN